MSESANEKGPHTRDRQMVEWLEHQLQDAFLVIGRQQLALLQAQQGLQQAQQQVAALEEALKGEHEPSEAER